MSYVIITAYRKRDRDRLALLCRALRDEGTYCWINDSEMPHRLQCESAKNSQRATAFIWKKLDTSI